jgi:hypothetical protein
VLYVWWSRSSHGQAQPSPGYPSPLWLAMFYGRDHILTTYPQEERRSCRSPRCIRDF